VIAGTGSVAYGESGVRDPIRVGGFGYLFGDEGSSYAIARTALAGAMRMTDRGVLTDLGSAALAFFDCSDLRALARRSRCARSAVRNWPGSPGWCSMRRGWEIRGCGYC